MHAKQKILPALLNRKAVRGRRTLEQVRKKLTGPPPRRLTQNVPRKQPKYVPVEARMKFRLRKTE